MEGTPKDIIEWLFTQDRDKIYIIKEYKPKRSLNANAYLWLIITKIANAMRIDKECCYLDMLRSYGQSELVSVVSEIDVSGYFKYYEPVGTTFLQGKEFTHYRIYKGSSEYDTKEMSVLIDGVVQEAHQLGIDTMTPNEIEHLKTMWRA